jgi:hypothetical protein
LFPNSGAWAREHIFSKDIVIRHEQNHRTGPKIDFNSSIKAGLSEKKRRRESFDQSLGQDSLGRPAKARAAPKR